MAAALTVGGAAVAQDDPRGHPLAGTQWVLRKIQGIAVPNGNTLVFAEDKVTGSTGCNRFWAPVDYPSPATIDIGAPQSARLYCRGAMGAERAYLASLETVTHFTVEDRTLQMMLADGDVFLELELAGAPPH